MCLATNARLTRIAAAAILLPFALILFAQSAHAASFTSVTNGCWSNPFTWDALGASGTPVAGDDVTVAASTQVFLCANEQADNVTIAALGTLHHSGYALTMFGSYICEGTHSSSGTLSMRGSASDTIRIPSTASFSYTGTFAIYGTKTVTATSEVKYMFCNVAIQADDTLNNNGILWNRGTINGANAGSAFIQGADSRMFVHNSMMATGHYDGTAAGSLTYFWADLKNIPIYGGTSIYGDVICRSNSTRKVILQADIDLEGYFYMNSSVTDVRTNGFTIEVEGDFRSFGANFIAGQGHVEMDGSATQEIRPETAMTSIEFEDLAIEGSDVTLGIDIEVHNNLNIEVGGVLDVTATNYAINIEGDFDNDGTLTQRDGTVTFTGTAAQMLTGSATTTFCNLEVDKSAGTATITSGTFQIDSTLTITAGILDPAGNLTILSDATSTARIAPIASGSIAGSLTVQRYISARDAAWQDLASPVATTLLDWDYEIFMSGLSGGLDGGAWDPILQQVFQSVKKWDEVSGAYTDVTLASEATDALEGFELYLGTDTVTSAAVTLDSRGIPYQGDQMLPLTFTSSQGWHLVGNPYASWIEWDSVFANTATIDNNFYIANAATGNFTTYGAGDLIPPGQGFWIHCTGVSALNISETHKTTTSSSSFFREPAAWEEALTLHITSNNNNYSHQSAVHFSSSASDAYEAKDALYLESPIAGAPAITTSSADGKLLTVNALSSLQRAIEIPVNVTASGTGLHTVEVRGLDALGHYSCIALEDHVTGKVYDLKSSNTVTVQMHREQNTKRFTLHMAIDGYGICETLADIDPDNTNTITAQPEGDNIAVSLQFDEPETVKLSVYNTLGQLVIAETTYANVINQRVQLRMPTGSGIYTVVARFGDRTETRKLFID